MKGNAVEVLFQLNPIGAIAAIQQNLKQDVEKKKDELRQIVG